MRVTVPYVGPGPRVVDLTKFPVFRCGTCGDIAMEIPERGALDALIRRLGTPAHYTRMGPVAQLRYEEGRWRLIPSRATGTS